jgi:hypothetical protein
VIRLLEVFRKSPVFVEDLPEKEQGTCHLFTTGTLFTAHPHNTRSQHTLTHTLIALSPSVSLR